MTIAAAVATDVAVDIVVPVHNEESDLEPSIRRLHAYLTHAFPLRARITIADNASTDRTWPLAQELAASLADVRAIRLEAKGRGHALRAAWSDSDAPVVAYMDVDLSTDLAALLPLVAPVLSGHSDIAIGTRLSRHARVVRGPKREVISRCYNLLLRSVLRTRFSDAQCGFKAVRADRVRMLLPQIEDNGWFFDTELLVLAERAGLRIHEVPVDWTDDPDSRVDLVATALGDLRGVARLLRGQLFRFASIGVVSTIAYLLLYVAMRGVTGAQIANATALLVTAVANTAANRRITFGVTGLPGAVREHVQGLLVFGLALALTASTLGLLNAVTNPSRPVEVIALVVANLAATALRFVVLRGWVFRRYATAGAR
jgi:putative flippase GtrA